MASVFSQIIARELPGRFVWADPQCVAFMTIAPIAHGHTLVVPRAEIDHWVDLPGELRDRMFEVSQIIGSVLIPAFKGERVGMVIAGFEVPHTHIHVYPATTIDDFDQTRAMKDVPAAELDDDAETLRKALREHGFGEHVENA